MSVHLILITSINFYMASTMRSCTVMHLGRQGINGGVCLYYLDAMKLRYSGIYQLMLCTGIYHTGH